MKAYRHGEILFVKTKTVPKDIKQSKTNIIETGSHGNNHTFSGGSLYLLLERQDFTIGYLRAKDTTLYHPEHGNEKGEAKLPDGNYEIRKQQEFTPEGLVPVID